MHYLCDSKFYIKMSTYPNIYVDEAGNTGSDILNPDPVSYTHLQSLFRLAFKGGFHLSDGFHQFLFQVFISRFNRFQTLLVQFGVPVEILRESVPVHDIIRRESPDKNELAELPVCLCLLYTSNMVKNFQETVKIYQQGKEFYDGLKKVKNLVKDARKVQQTILMVGDITDIYVTNFERMLSDPYFSTEELSAIAAGYTILLEESANVLNDLRNIVNEN